MTLRELLNDLTTYADHTMNCLARGEAQFGCDCGFSEWIAAVESAMAGKDLDSLLRPVLGRLVVEHEDACDKDMSRDCFCDANEINNEIERLSWKEAK